MTLPVKALRHRVRNLCLFFCAFVVLCLISTGVGAELFKRGRVVIKGITIIELIAEEDCFCKQMRPVMDEIKKELKNSIKVITIDVYKQKEKAKKYEIRSIPTYIFINQEGKEFGRYSGLITKKEIITYILYECFYRQQKNFRTVSNFLSAITCLRFRAGYD